MSAILTADALRAARSLAGLSQRDVEERTGIARKSLVFAEGHTAPRPRTLSRLRAFYEEQGLEFLGTVDVSSGLATGLGVRWRMPEPLTPAEIEKSPPHSEASGLAFAAARALVGVKQSEAAQGAGIPEYKVRTLEAGVVHDQVALGRLRAFFEQSGVEFLGWGDVSRGVFYGVGVRWKITNSADQVFATLDTSPP